MDPEKIEKLQFVAQLFPFIAVIVSVAVGGWVITTWMRIKNGYPLETSWGKAIYPQKNEETLERVKLLTTENAQLRAELGSVKDRLATVERIVTDDSHRLTQEIDALRVTKN
jgi:predicted metal-binding membrane protein